MTFTIRQIPNWDKRILRAIQKKTTGGSNKFGMYNIIGDYLDKSLFEYEEYGCKYYLGVLKKGNITVGSSIIRTSETGLSKTALIVGIYVKKKFRRQGFGTFILKKILKKIQQLRRTKVTFYIRYSKPFWQSFGANKRTKECWATRFVKTLA